MKDRFFNKNILLIIIKVIATVVLLYYITNFVEYSNLKDALENANYKYIILAFILTFLNIFWQFRRWKLICISFLKISDNKKILKSLLIGISGGLITPYGIGEYIARRVPFKSISFVDVALATAADQFSPLIVVYLLGGFSFVLLMHLQYSVSIIITLCLSILLIILIWVIFISISNKKLWKKIFEEKLSDIKFIQKHISKIKILGNLSPQLLNKLTLINLFHYLTYILQLALLLAAFTNSFNFILFMWISSLIMFFKIIIPQLTIMDIGIRESSAVFLMNVFGLSAAAGFNAALVLYAINLVIPAIVGSIIITSKNND